MNGLANIILSEAHSIIAGCTGSGKSTCLDMVLYNLNQFPYGQKDYCIIDLKMISLLRWEHLPNCKRYARTPKEALKLLNDIKADMDKRMRVMMSKGQTNSAAQDSYLIIDEAADLFDTVPHAKEIIKHIVRIGRALNWHVILATQDPSRKCLDHAVVQNFTCALALRCKSKIESMQITGFAGAENLPRYGSGLLMTPNYTPPVIVDVPMIDERLLPAAR